MRYTIKAHPTEFSGTMYRSRLEARWAAFFHLAGIDYQYEPIDLPGWSPDFRLTWKCYRSDCVDFHSILVEVKPYPRIKDFEGHKCMNHFYGHGDIPACSSAAFGENPFVTCWEMVHGNGGGLHTIESDVHWMGKVRHPVNINHLWAQAGNLTQWSPK